MSGAAGALAQVVLIDLTLAGDNAVVISLAVQGLPAPLRRRAILVGLALATAIRIVLSAVAVSLLAVIGLTLAGGLLLLWVCWKMLREFRTAEPVARQPAPLGLRRAVLRILVADLSMSLDNVLAVAGAARAHIGVLVAGLVLSILLTAVAASLLERLLARFRWIAWLGLAIVAYVALDMIAAGWRQAAPFI